MSAALIGATEVARRLGISRGRVYLLARGGTIPPGVSVRVGRALRFDPTALDAWIAAGGQALPGGWRQEEGGGETAARG